MASAAGGTMFSDVPDSHFAVPFINGLVEEGIVSGYADGTFRPGDQITRAEAAVIVSRIGKKTGAIPAMYTILDHDFVDIRSTDWWYYPVKLVESFSIMRGDTNASGDPVGRFRPLDTLLRVEAAKILVSVAMAGDLRGAMPSFPDVVRGQWYEPFVEQAYLLSMVDGYADSAYFGVEDLVTRGAFAKMAYFALYPEGREGVGYICEGEEIREGVTKEEEPEGVLEGDRNSALDTMSGSLLEENVLVDRESLCPGIGRVSCLEDDSLPFCSQYSGASPQFLQAYPFLDEAVRLVEGYAGYDGNLEDEIGAFHGGVDYVKYSAGSLVPFDVTLMHDGYIFQGTSSSWGAYVIAFYPEQWEGNWYATLYSHLTAIPGSIPWYAPGGPVREGKLMTTGEYVGLSDTSGDTKGNVQLHVELLKIDPDTARKTKMDVYGVNARYSSGAYPQVGESLEGVPHHWVRHDIMP